MVSSLGNKTKMDYFCQPSTSRNVASTINQSASHPEQSSDSSSICPTNFLDLVFDDTSEANKSCLSTSEVVSSENPVNCATDDDDDVTFIGSNKHTLTQDIDASTETLESLINSRYRYGNLEFMAVSTSGNKSWFSEKFIRRKVSFYWFKSF